jgi:hypothetical protein
MEGTGQNTIGSAEQAQCLFLQPGTAEMTEGIYLRNVLIIQPVPCLNLGRLLPGDPAQVLVLALP